jgi:hypothetical protein
MSMGATRDDFIKYPRTPHLFGAKGTDDDKHLSREESEAFIARSFADYRREAGWHDRGHSLDYDSM